jgi:hypothetical protein
MRLLALWKADEATTDDPTNVMKCVARAVMELMKLPAEKSQIRDRVPCRHTSGVGFKVLALGSAELWSGLDCGRALRDRRFRLRPTGVLPAGR